jgi:zinc transporter 2
VVGAVISVLIIWLITGILVYEAILRIITNEEEVNADVMLITACVGVYVNVFMCLVLHQHDHHKANHHRTSACCGLCARKKQEDHTLQLDDIGKEKSTDTRHISVYAAYLHVISDLVQGIGVVITAYIIKFFVR